MCTTSNFLIYLQLPHSRRGHGGHGGHGGHSGHGGHDGHVGHGGDQALAGSRIFNSRIYGTGFCRIPGSRDFLGWD